MEAKIIFTPRPLTSIVAEREFGGYTLLAIKAPDLAKHDSESASILNPEDRKKNIWVNKINFTIYEHKCP